MHTDNFVTLPLTIIKNGKQVVPLKSGLNWGQRIGREQNQAYLSVPIAIRRLKFFPEIKIPFIIECDDGEQLKCVIAQADGKAIHTCTNNSAFGKYFRKRLGIPDGYLVTVQHLYRYGRVSVDIFKKNEYKYYMNFSNEIIN